MVEHPAEALAGGESPVGRVAEEPAGWRRVSTAPESPASDPPTHPDPPLPGTRAHLILAHLGLGPARIPTLAVTALM